MPDEREASYDCGAFRLYRRLDQTRVRIGWFGRAIIETMCETPDGERFWKRAPRGLLAPPGGLEPLISGSTNRRSDL